MASSEDSAAAVYVAWTTFKNALDQLAQGVPNRIDRSVFPGLSGGAQGQLIAAFRSLGLIDEDGKPQAAMHAVAVEDETRRKAELLSLIEARYQKLFALDLMKTTPAELAELMESEFKVSGTTRDKAVRFFLGALDYLEVPVSPLFEKKRPGRRPGSSSTTKRRTPRKQRSARKDSPDSPQRPNGDGAGHSTTVKLRSGGSVTLSATIDMFSIDASDREFVFELIDRLRGYDPADVSTSGSDNGDDDAASEEGS